MKTLIKFYWSNKFYNCIIRIPKICFLLISFIYGEHTAAQVNSTWGPFNYQLMENSDTIYTQLDVNKTLNKFLLKDVDIEPSQDGLMVQFDVSLNVNSLGTEVELFALEFAGIQRIIVSYSNKTVKVKRKMPDENLSYLKAKYSYDYYSHDPLFITSENTQKTWTVQICLTAHFMMISTELDGKYYMSPFFLGVNYHSSGGNFSDIGTDSNVKDSVEISFGEDISNEKIYSFSYKDWYKAVQEQFIKKNTYHKSK